jgi:hypothetical protein
MASRFILLRAGHRGEPASLEWPRAFAAPKLTFRLRRTAPSSLISLRFPKLVRFDKMAVGALFVPAAVANRRRCCPLADRTTIGRLACLSMTLKTAGFGRCAGRRARRHRARNPQIALPRMGQLVARGATVPRTAADRMGFFQFSNGPITGSYSAANTGHLNDPVPMRPQPR